MAVTVWCNVSALLKINQQKLDRRIKEEEVEEQEEEEEEEEEPADE